MALFLGGKITRIPIARRRIRYREYEMSHREYEMGHREYGHTGIRDEPSRLRDDIETTRNIQDEPSARRDKPSQHYKSHRKL